MRTSIVWLLTGFFVGWAGLAAPAAEPEMAAIQAGFHADDVPVRMEYELAYRFLNIEMSRLGKIVLLTTKGTFQRRVTGQPVPAVLVEVRLDSADHHKPPARDRVSIHDRILAVVTMPELNALVFAKENDEFLNPVFGRATVSRAVSCYDTQSGRLDYSHRDIPSGTVSTNLSNPEALLVLSRRVGTLANFLLGRYYGRDTVAADGRLSVNADGEVVALLMETVLERSPAFLTRQRLNALRVATVPEEPTRARLHDFHGWAVPFRELADRFGDDAVRAAARRGVEAVVPLVVQYDLRLGAIRATLASLGVGDAPAVASTASGTQAPL
jgi:hypothetical protein